MYSGLDDIKAIDAIFSWLDFKESWFFHETRGKLFSFFTTQTFQL